MRTFSFFLLFLVPFHASAAIFISELMWMGSDLSTADEWIEFVCTEETDLSGMRLISVTGTGSEQELYRFENEVVAESGAVFLLSNYAAAASRLLEEPAFRSSALSLPNAKLHLRLYDGSGTLLDEVDDGIGAPFAGFNETGQPKASMERISFDLPGSDPSAWSSATKSFGFDDGVPIFGTPGVAFEVQKEEPEPEIDPPVETGAVAVPQIVLSEFLPDPIGSDDQEWIELHNPSDQLIHLEDLEIGINGRYTDLSGSIEPEAFLVLHKSVFGFSLPNNGGTVELVFGDEILDTWTYPAAEQGISVGRVPDSDEWTSFCLPSPGLLNDGASQELSIVVQSGQIEGVGSTSVNLQVVSVPSLPSLASCIIDFGDGSVQETCNPSSHSFKSAGTYTVFVESTTQCGNTLTQQMQVTVHPKNEPFSTSKTALPLAGEECTPDPDADIHISEFLPAPKSKSGQTEWIELKSSSNIEFSLCGWALDDAEGGSKPIALDSYILPSFGYLVLTGSALSLHNTADAVRLISPEGDIVESISYDKAVSGSAFALTSDGDFAWTGLPTPGRDNLFPEDLSVSVRVQRVIDGDTFEVMPVETSDLFPAKKSHNVRLLGIDTPETVDPKKDPEKGGKEAADFLRALMEGRDIELRFDSEIEDTYGRMLAYAYLTDGTFVQAEILKNGYSKGYFRYAFLKSDEFKDYESEAKESGLGLWSDGSDEIEEALEEEQILEEESYDSSPVLLSEIFVRPDTKVDGLLGQEWIEIYNPGEEDVWLAAWTLKDNSKSLKPFTFGANDFIGAGEYLVLPKSRTKLSLNDDGEEITLASPSGERMSVTVPKVTKAGYAYAFDGQEWCLTTFPTLEEENECLEPVTQVKSSNKKVVQSTKKAAVKKASSSSKKTSALLASLAENSGDPSETSEEPLKPNYVLWVSLLSYAGFGIFLVARKILTKQ